MNQTLRLPACYRYIKGDATADKLYTLAAKISPRHVEDIAEKDFHSLLIASHIITADHPLPQTVGNIPVLQLYQSINAGISVICALTRHGIKMKWKQKKASYFPMR